MASWLGSPKRATALEQRTMEPPPAPLRVIALTDARRMENEVPRLVSITAASSASLVMCAALSTTEPTQFATPSTRPWRSMAPAMAASASPAAAEFALRCVCTPGRAAASASSLAASRPTSVTRAPDACNSFDSSEPMPPVAPKMTYTGASLPALAVASARTGPARPRAWLQRSGLRLACRSARGRLRSAIRASERCVFEELRAENAHERGRTGVLKC